MTRRRSVPIPWEKPFGTRFVLQRTERVARLTAAAEPSDGRLYIYQALCAAGIVIFPPADGHLG